MTAPRARSGARPPIGGPAFRWPRPAFQARPCHRLISRRALRRAPEVAIPTPDAALAVGLGGRAAGGLHLDPPLAVRVVGRFSKLIMLFR